MSEALEIETGTFIENRGVDGRRVYRILILLLVMALPFAYLYAGRLAANPDPYIYSQIAKQFLAGDKLYTEIVLDKGPLVPLFYAVPQLFVPRSSLAVAYFGGLVIAAHALIFAYAFRATPKAALACVLVTLIAPLSYIDWVWFSTEHATNLFVAGSLVICLKICRSNRITAWDAIWTGVLPVLALNTRQPTVLLMLAPSIILCVTRLPMRERLRSLGIAGVSGLVTLGLVLIFVAIVSDLHSYYYFMVEFPQKYRDWPRTITNPRVTLLVQFFQQPLAFVALTFFIGALTTRYRWLVLASLISGLAICLLPRKDFQHYMMSLLPSVVLWTGLTIERWKDAGKGAWLAASVLGALILYRAYEVLDYARVFPTALAQEEVAAKVDEVASPDSTLTVWGPRMTMMEPIVFSSKLKQANKTCWMFMLRPPFSEIPTTTPVPELLKEYVARPPTVIVVHEATLKLVQLGTVELSRSDLRLIQLLLGTYPYTARTSINGYTVLLRNTNVPSTIPSNLFPASTVTTIPVR